MQEPKEIIDNRNRLKDLCPGYVRAQRKNNKTTKRH